MVYIYEYTEVA